MNYEIAVDGTFGVEYDNLGRTTSLPAKYAGGGKLETSYYVNDLTHSQTQDGITNTYNLDAALRQRERVREGGSEEGTEIYHYAGGSDSPAWVDQGEGQWTRYIGGLGAMATEDGATEEVTLQLANMHGDIVATADIDPEATELLSTQTFDEYGNPMGESTPKLGWLGAKLRRTELPSGVIHVRRLGIEFVLDVAPTSRKPSLVTARAQKRGQLTTTRSRSWSRHRLERQTTGADGHLGLTGPTRAGVGTLFVNDLPRCLREVGREARGCQWDALPAG